MLAQVLCQDFPDAEPVEEACAFQFIATFRSHLEKATYAGEGVLLGPKNPFRGSDTIDMAVLALPEEERAAIQALGKDVQARKVALLDAAQRLHTQTLSEVSHRRRFEDQISRRYFHVEKLHKQQLATWHDYLDASIHNAETAEAGLGGGEVPPVAVAPHVEHRILRERGGAPAMGADQQEASLHEASPPAANGRWPVVREARPPPLAVPLGQRQVRLVWCAAPVQELARARRGGPCPIPRK